MTDEAIFDAVLELVRGGAFTAQALDYERAAKRTGGGKPAVGNAEAEYRAEFAVAGRAALASRPMWLELFNLYYVAGKTRADVRRQLRITHGVFDHWAKQVKREVGRELRERDLYPPGRYRRKVIQG